MDDLIDFEIREHELRIARRDRRNRAILDALADGRTPPPSYPYDRPEPIYITQEDISTIRRHLDQEDVETQPELPYDDPTP
jgi:hypothetical protein